MLSIRWEMKSPVHYDLQEQDENIANDKNSEQLLIGDYWLGIPMTDLLHAVGHSEDWSNAHSTLGAVIAFPMNTL